MQHLTRVDRMFVRDRINRWLRFGAPIKECVVDSSRRTAYFGPHTNLGYVTWLADDAGTRVWRIEILRTVGPEQCATRISGILPGAALLLRATRSTDVQRVLRLIDSIEACAINPVNVSPDYWCAAHNRLAAGEELPPFCVDSHAAYQLRRSLTP